MAEERGEDGRRKKKRRNEDVSRRQTSVERAAW